MNKQDLKQSIETALEQKEKEQLETLAKEAVSMYPNAAFGYAYLAQAILMDKPIAYAKAEYCLAKASQLEPRNTTYLAQFADLRMEQGDKLKSQIFWRKVLKIESNNLEALKKLGIYYLKETLNYKKAIEMFSQGIEHHPSHSPFYFFTASSYLKLKKAEQALEFYNQGLESKNGQEELDDLLLKVKIYQALKHTEGEISTWRSLIELDAHNSFYYYSLAKLLDQTEQYSEAAACYIQSIEHHDNPQAIMYYEAGEAFEKSEQYQKAIENFSKYTELSTDPSFGFRKQVQTQLKMGDYEAVVESAKKAQKIIEGEQEKNELAIAQGKALIELERYKEAVDLLLPISETPGTHKMNAYFLVSKVAFLLGKVSEAYESMKYASQQGFEEAIIFLRDYFHDHEYALRKETFSKHAANTTQNSASQLINRIKDTVWSFDDFKSDKADEYSPETLENFKKVLSSNTLFVSQKGMLIFSKRAVLLYAYKVNKETAKSASIELYSTDKQGKSKTTILTLMEDGRLSYKSNKGQSIIYKRTKATGLEPDTLNFISKYIQRETLELLGSTVQELADAVNWD